MEKRLYKTPEMIPCTCSNHLLLVPGTVCEVCMGMVMEAEALERTEPAVYDHYGPDYFEALERMFESFEFAA
jgi:hypothetical protein